jgi:hypothetical protein
MASGERKTNTAFIAACDKFMYFDVLNVESEESQESLVAPHSPRPGIPPIFVRKQPTTRPLGGSRRSIEIRAGLMQVSICIVQ